MGSIKVNGRTPGEKKGAGKEFVGKGFIYLMEAVPIPGEGSLTPASERS